MDTRDLVADIRLALAGEERASSRLAAHARRVARPVLRQYFRCTEDIEDCLQDVVIRAVRHLAQLRDGERFESWIAVIARRVALARQRDYRTLPLPIGIVEPAPVTPAPSTSPLAGDVRSALEALPPQRRRLLDLRYREGLGYAEIARELETTTPRVRRRLQGARDALRREALRHMSGFTGDGMHLTRQDLSFVYGAATLVDVDSAGLTRALHIAEGAVMGGSTHRVAVGTLSSVGPVPLVLDPEPLMELGNHPDAREGVLGWTDDAATLALDDGTRLTAALMECEPATKGHWQAATVGLPHGTEAACREVRELVETIAVAPWRREAHDEHALALLVILRGGGLALQTFGRGNVSYAMSGMLGSSDPGGAGLQMLLNRGYLRDCLMALPLQWEGVRVEYAGPHDRLRFVNPAVPEFAVAMMPIHRDTLTPQERETWAELLSTQADAVRASGGTPMGPTSP